MQIIIQECWSTVDLHQMRFPELYGPLPQADLTGQCPTVLCLQQCRCSRLPQKRSIQTIHAHVEAVRNIRSAAEEDKSTGSGSPLRGVDIPVTILPQIKIPEHISESRPDVFSSTGRLFLCYRLYRRQRWPDAHRQYGPG